MRLAELERFDAVSVDWFHRLTGAAMLSAVASEAAARVDLVHAGVLFPYRHLPGIPLYGVPALVVEWALTVAVALAMMLGWRLSVVVRVALAIALVSLSQRYSNHRALLVLVLAFGSLAPPDPRSEGFAERRWPNLALVRLELVIVYWASAVNKLSHGFASGETLTTLFGFSPALARPLALATIALELAIPILTFTSPRVAVAITAAMHLVFAYFLPATWSFGFLMVAMAVLAVRPVALRSGRA